MSTGRRILKNFLFLSFAEVITKVLGFVALAYLARVLGAEGFGKLGFATAILGYFGLLVNLGLNTLGAREVARNKEEAYRYVNNTLALRTVASITAFGLLAIFVCFIPKPLEVKKLILFSGLGLFTSAFVIEWVFQGIERMELIAIARVAKWLIYVGGVFWAVKSPVQILEIPFIRVGSEIVAVGILLLIYRRIFGSVKLEFNLKFWKQILRRSLPMGFSIIMITIYVNFDKLMLGLMQNMEVVGWYDAAYKIVVLVGTLPSLVLSVFFPMLSSCYSKNRNRLSRIANKYVTVMLTLGIPMGFGGTVLAPQIIRFIYGAGFEKAVLPLQILAWNITMIFINMAYGNPLLAWNKEKKYMKAVAIGAIVNLVLNPLLISRYSLVGASIATLLAEIAVFFGLYFEFQKVVAMPLLRYLLKPVAASGLMTLALLLLSLLSNNILMLLPLGIAVYLVAIIRFKVITMQDVKLICLRGGDKL